jgi:SAM-dependent methyltransferase
LNNVSAIFTNAKDLGFRKGSFDIAISGFMGWYDMYDFRNHEFKQQDSKANGIWRVLREGGRFVCGSWEKQEGLTWMENAIHRYYPEILGDTEYLKRRPVGMAYEKAEGYEIIFKSAGFRNIDVIRESMTFVSSDEEEWWKMMLYIGWDKYLEKIETAEKDRFEEIKGSILKELQSHKQSDGIHFEKIVFFVRGEK